MKTRKMQQGVTLLEAILAIMIASAILVSGIRMYQSYQRDSDIRNLSYNVETLAQSTANFYYANCWGQHRPTGPVADKNRTFEPGALHPDSNPPNPYHVNIQTNLRDAGFLANNIRPNPLVDSSIAEGGYLVQMNKYESIKTVCTEEVDCAAVDAVQIGTTINYSIMIGVKLANSDIANYVQSKTGASCVTTLGTNYFAEGGAKPSLISCEANAGFAATCQGYYDTLNSNPGGVIGFMAVLGILANQCPLDAGGGEFSGSFNDVVLYERHPFSIQNQSVPTMWPSLNITKRFTDHERTPSMDSLISTSHDPEYNYYLCGS